MNEPKWLTRQWLDAIHFQQLKRFGGLYGVRDEGAIESALARPINRWAYEQTRDIACFAAAYGYGLARTHGYSDGNKRVSFMAMAIFLDLNGWALEASEVDVVDAMVATASGDVDEARLVSWVQSRVVRVRDA